MGEKGKRSGCVRKGHFTEVALKGVGLWVAYLVSYDPAYTKFARTASLGLDFSDLFLQEPLKISFPWAPLASPSSFLLLLPSEDSISSCQCCGSASVSTRKYEAGCHRPNGQTGAC